MQVQDISRCQQDYTAHLMNKMCEELQRVRCVLLLNIFMKMSGLTVAVMGYSYNSILKVGNGVQKHPVCLVLNMEMTKALSLMVCF